MMENSEDHHEFVASGTEVKLEIEEFDALAYHENALKTVIKNEFYEIEEQTNPCNRDTSFTIKMELDENSHDAYYGLNLNKAEDQIVTDLESKIDINNCNLKTKTCAQPLDISDRLCLEDANNFPSSIKLRKEENLISVKSSLLQNCSSVKVHYECDSCNKKFSNENKFDKHKQKHSETKPHKCEFCSKSFVRVSDLNRHIRIHTREKPFLCEFCKKGFSQSYNLKVHRRTHTGDKPYLCDICNKGFALFGNLRAHRRSHAGEKPYVCDTCNKGFAQLSTLRAHRRSHTGDKPYLCETCNKGFAQLSTLRVHRRSHTGDKTYVCETCNKDFANSSNLNRHKTTHSVNTN